MRPVIILLLISIFFSCKKNNEHSKKRDRLKKVISKYTCVPPVTDLQWYKEDNIAPLLEGYDVIDYPITTKNKLAQKYFNQGMENY
ncbi:hypothetical protein [Algibacter sp. PT7-4]|uniref:hypothetical protein n=1 Tax=Algibacter ulvanivorans TaxID=3400999 RepID=UPI003AB0FAF5